jgi:TRAP-type transport system periplasmic protein
VMDAGDEVGLKIAQDRGNTIVTLDEAETQRWKDAAEPLIQKWVDEMTASGMEAQALVDDARALIEKNSAGM